MATVARKRSDVQPDEFCDDGTTLKLNFSRPFGMIYADGLFEAKFEQNNILYRGDRTSVGYVPAAQRGLTPVEPTKEELQDENVSLKAQLDALTKRIAALESERDTLGGKPKKSQPTLW